MISEGNTDKGRKWSLLHNPGILKAFKERETETYMKKQRANIMKLENDDMYIKFFIKNNQHHTIKISSYY